MVNDESLLNEPSPNEPARYDRRRIRLVGRLVHPLAVPVWALVTRIAWEPPLHGVNAHLPFAGRRVVVRVRRVFV